MRYVKQNVASEDTVQLFDSSQNPVTGVLFNQVQVYIRKEGAAGFTQKTIGAGDWTDRGNGNYAVDFAAGDFDTLGLFQYQVISTGAAFVGYQDSLQVVDVIPSFPPQPPTINAQTDSPPGVTPDPVPRGSTLTINGSDLGGATSVTIGGVQVPIIGNTLDQIQVTVTKPPTSPYVNLGQDQEVVVTTAGGTATAYVDVVLDPADIPGQGMCDIWGDLFGELGAGGGFGEPKSGIPVYGRILDQPNIEDGVMWLDDEVKVVTDDNGIFHISMPKLKKVEIHIPRGNYRRVFEVPDLDTANLFTEIPNPNPTPFP